METNSKSGSHSIEQLSLPVSRGFVIQIEANVEIQKGQFNGRIEHIITGKSTRFHSLKEMLAFIEAMI